MKTLKDYDIKIDPSMFEIKKEVKGISKIFNFELCSTPYQLDVAGCPVESEIREPLTSTLPPCKNLKGDL